MTDDRKIYADKLETMTDEDFVTEVEDKVWFSAFASNNPRAPAHWQTDLCHDEAKRREKLWLYQKGWNKAYSSCGYEVTESDKERARPPK